MVSTIMFLIRGTKGNKTLYFKRVLPPLGVLLIYWLRLKGKMMINLNEITWPAVGLIVGIWWGFVWIIETYIEKDKPKT